MAQIGLSLSAEPLIINDKAKEVEMVDGVPLWVINTLKNHDNCYVNDIDKTVYELSEILGFKVEITPAQKGGYIISKVKDKKDYKVYNVKGEWYEIKRISRNYTSRAININ